MILKAAKQIFYAYTYLANVSRNDIKNIGGGRSVK